MKSGVYIMENTANGLMYIGSSVNVKTRRNQHFNELKKDKHANTHLQRAWNKYSEDAFVYKILLYCENKDLLMYEQLCIDSYDSYNNGYNQVPKAGSTLGRKMPESAKEKLRQDRIGKSMSPEHYKKYKEAMETEEVKANYKKGMANAVYPKTKSPEHIAKVAAALKGRKVSDETKEKLRQANLGKKRGPHNEETKEKIRLGNIGKNTNRKPRGKNKLKENS